MKRRQLIQHLKQHRCYLVREGGKHSWWGRTDTNDRTAVPRHTEINNQLAKKICKDLGIPNP
ncbi:MAG: type II toxin-antitoxin system HicA family toxin [Candidatus Poribacteria bacterium]|nr:type II toxin-antitoxin system HicA family toxin [Candidatus Poribacteria bacterium]